MTIFLSLASMPLAIALGLLVALGRLYGPRPLSDRLLAAYVELLRGTPLMLQLFVLFFLLPELGIELPPLVAGIARAGDQLLGLRGRDLPGGLQAIPAGQMEAALALGMSRRLALRRVIVPAGGPDRDPAGDERLHRAVQGHVGLLGDHAGRADQAVLDPGQQHRRRARVRGGRRRCSTWR